MLPLAGITVVALEQAVAAPFATRQLADLGARVVKVERPGGGDFARGYDSAVNGMSAYFAWLNRSKESVTLDLKDGAAQVVLDRLLDRADVFVQNLAPGAVDRLGLGADAVRRTRPRLVTCDVSGYGATGPYRDQKAYDLLIQGEAGLLSITGSPDAPAKVGISVADIAGGMYAFTAVLTALYARERTGEGQACSVSLFDALAEWMGHPLNHTVHTGRPLPRAGTSHATIAPYGAFRAGDGAVVLLGVQNDREWRRLCADVLGRPELADDERFATNPARVAARRELTAIVEDAFSAHDGAEVARRLDAAGIAHARAGTVADLAEHPQLTARDRWRDVDSPVGPVRALLPPVVSATDYRMDPIPALGAHTDAVLAELGYGAAEIAALRARGAI